nr:hypothetical protein 28 [bacterium]
MRTSQELLADITALKEQGAAATLNGHRAGAEKLLWEWFEHDDDDLEDLNTAGHWLWNRLDSEVCVITTPDGKETTVYRSVDFNPDGIDWQAACLEHNRVRVATWMTDVEALLLKHWGDFEAFTGTFVDVTDEGGVQAQTFTPGAATDEANRLWALWEALDIHQAKDEGEVDLLLVYKLRDALEEHLDPDRVIANLQRKRLKPDLEPLPPITAMEPVEEFKLWCEHRRKGWGFGYRAAVNKYGREFGPKFPMTLQESKDFNLEQAKNKEAGIINIAPLVKYTELRQLIFDAAVESDEDGYNAGLGEMAQRFRKDERKLLPELLRMLRSKYSKRTYRTGEIDIRKVGGLSYALEGFLPAGEVIHVFAPWFAGKTSLCVGMAASLIQGTGFLDVDIATSPRSCLFIQTDAGAARFAIELEKQDLLSDDRFVPGASQMLHIWAPDDAQGVEAWSATFRGLVKLREEAQRLGVGAIFIDSVKGMMSGTGMDYTHNETVNQFVTLLRQTVAQPLHLPVVLINHKGTDQKEGAGAKAWSEACGQVIELAFVTEDKQQLNNVRELIIRKDSIGGPRRFHYKMEDGQLRVAMGTEVVKDNSDAILQALRTWSLHGTKEFTRKRLMGEDTPFAALSRATKDRALERLCVRGGPLVKVGRGRFKLREDL